MKRQEIKQLFGKNFIGFAEQNLFFKKIGLDYNDIQEPHIEYPDSLLIKASNKGYILICCIKQFLGNKITLRYLRDKFGFNPNKFEPCFYNQDWYLNEEFMDIPLENKWYLIKKDVLEGTRSEQPEKIISNGINFPSAILCCYVFFAYYFYNNEYLWWHDFVWCCDVDHNGDRIYVGKYNDIDGVNKNGFSIHRHLALRHCYGALNIV